LSNFKEDIDKYKDQITEEEKTKLDEATKAINDSVTGDDAEAIQKAITEFYTALGPINAKKSEAESVKEPSADSEKKDDTVIDAEVKESV
jgi:molecular chaperone DnaK (HSP70)